MAEAMERSMELSELDVMDYLEREDDAVYSPSVLKPESKPHLDSSNFDIFKR